MGRELKRVPIDFDWPLEKTWKGYINPYYKYSSECKSCDKTGYNPATKKIAVDYYDFAGNGTRWLDNITQEEVDHLLSNDRLRVHKDGKWQALPVTADIVNEANKNGGFLGNYNHDAINRMYLVEFRAKSQGVYGVCEVCNGSAEIWSDKKIDGKLPRILCEEWESEDPPIGEGYQLWSTTSEGNPMSPVFDSLEKLAEWCEYNATTFASNQTTKEEWLKMLSEDNIYHKEGNTIFL